MNRTTNTLLLVLIAIHSAALLSPAQVVGIEEEFDVTPPAAVRTDGDQEEIESGLTRELVEEIDSVEPLPETPEFRELPELGVEDGFSEIHVLKPKYVTGIWAGLSLKDVFEEEIAAGLCRLTSVENLVFVRTHDLNLLEKITSVFDVLDVPEDNPRHQEIAQTHQALGSAVQVRIEEDPRYREILTMIESHQEELGALSGSDDTEQLAALRQRIVRLKSDLQQRRKELLPRILERIRTSISTETAGVKVAQNQVAQSRPSDAQTLSLVESWKKASSEERAEIEDVLTEHVGMQFEERQQRQQQQIEQLQHRLQRLEASVQVRKGSRDKIIKKTVDSLLKDAPIMDQVIPTSHVKPAANQSTTGVPASSDIAGKRTAIQITNNAPRTYSKQEILILRKQAKNAEGMYRAGLGSQEGILRAQAEYQAACTTVRQQVSRLETELRLRELDLKEARSSYAANRSEVERLRTLRAEKAVTISVMEKAIAQVQRAAIDVERATLQFEAAQAKLESIKQVQASLDDEVTPELPAVFLDKANAEN